ncbi:MAG: GerMN domain-containing protein [Clostridiales bacterium]|nr:GerMN domain-containing protein [Clostridiales bacterium]
MNRKRLPRLMALLLSAVLLSGCSRAVPMSSTASVTLPPAENHYAAPLPDAEQEHAETVMLSLPSAADGQLIMVPERMLLPSDRHPAEATVRKLLSFTGNDVAQQLFPQAGLQLQQGGRGVEVSGDVATVDLGANANLLSRQDLLTLRRAISNTLVQWRDIRYVNVLVAGYEPGIDADGRAPAGSLQATRNEDAPALWDSLSARASLDNPDTQRFSSVCTLYFPASYGRGILAEARTVSFPGQTRKQIAVSLLGALSAGPQAITQAPPMPDLNALLAEPPRVELDEETGFSVVHLHFLDIANETFINAGIPRSIMMAAITYTLGTFMPRLSGLKISIGNEQIEAIVPSGIYEGAGEQILFSGGLLRRADFSTFLLANCTLYFGQGQDGLARVRRPVPHALAYDRRYLLEQLIGGPQAYDNVSGIQGLFPAGVTGEDLIAVGREGDTALVNLSQNLLDLSRGLSPRQERALIYSMVNTLCDTRATQRVRFFINGQQPETLAGDIYLPGEFLRNPEIVR